MRPAVTMAVVLMMLTSATVLARDIVDRITTPLNDPWLVRPPILDTGMILPGEDSVVACAPEYDAAMAARLFPAT